ncbi:MAG: hypothetical protein ACKPA9_10500, partial [Microcystis sp.]
IFINFRALLDREGAWGIFYSVSSEEPSSFVFKMRIAAFRLLLLKREAIFRGCLYYNVSLYSFKYLDA